MGCDIHMYMETKVNGLWKSNGVRLDVQRNYRLFSLLGLEGRNTYDIEPLQKSPYKLPLDVSSAVLDAWLEYEPDGHSPGWLTCEMLDGVDLDEIIVEGVYDFPVGQKFIETRRSLLDRIPDFDIIYSKRDVRFVFFFDN